MATTRLTGTDGKQYDVDYDPGIAALGLDDAAQVATVKPATVTIRSVAPVVVTAPPPPPPVVTPSTALAEAIRQNTVGNSEGFPKGVPTSYDWYKGKKGLAGLTPAPAGFTAMTGWGVIYQQVGAPVSPNSKAAAIQMHNFKAYVHLTDGTWLKVQDQATMAIDGAHFAVDFAGNQNTPWSSQKLADGSVTMDAPTDQYNDHFYPRQRGVFAAGKADGVYVVCDMKINDPAANFVVQMGADWWRDASAPYLADFSNNPGLGMANWIKLGTAYRTLYYTSLSAAQLTANPPPGLK
ncbi:hypothetical protein [Bradyrhizobium elkanii]|uniref:hypothetical protein n=1 Tax=Bradyrhizobium elkanii TaxID=29448 RepID=UPI00216A2616|nr:hypothetical protein [Bradyrhizobium elkanii]MCS3690973.1 hypothetical protein [Bradyrhizobium elkanii]